MPARRCAWRVAGRAIDDDGVDFGPDLENGLFHFVGLAEHAPKETGRCERYSFFRYERLFLRYENVVTGISEIE